MNFGLSFSYVFKDEEWFKKVAIPALCGLIPVVGPFVIAGWGLSATRNVIDGREENALPKLSFGADLGRGFMAILIQTIYTVVPVMIMSGIAVGLFGFAGGLEGGIGQTVLFVLGICFGLIGLLLAILLVFMSSAAVANYVAKGKFGAAFSFKEVFGMVKKSFVSWLLVLLGMILAFFIIAPLGMAVCGVGLLLTTAYGTAIYSHLLGQAYNKSVEPAVGEMETL
jgi:hypothetical protein